MIIVNNEELLRRPCLVAAKDEIVPIITQLEQELENSAKIGRPGIGLAAPQCDILKKIAIVRINNFYRVDLVNCKIANAYDAHIFEEEGCLSFPGRVENTKRFSEIHIVENEVYPYEFIATGLLAVVIQHELDHLSGVILPDIAIKQEKIIKKQRPNDICNCGSKLKVKHCCGKLKYAR